MEGLKNTRVVVIDDDIGEASPILRSLSQRGIAAAYFTGDVDELPPVGQGLIGVRLIFLDARLQGEGAADNIGANLVAVLERVLSVDNGPYGIVLWTNHPEHCDDFKQRLFEEGAIKLPLFVKVLTKATFQDEDDFNLTALRSELQKQVDPMHGYRVLFQWEQEAASSTSDVVASLDKDLEERDTDIETTAANTLKRLGQTLKKLAGAELGQHLSAKNFCDGVFSGLNPIFFDRISTKTRTGLDECSKALFKSTAQTNKTAIAKLNTKIHLDLSSRPPFSAGSVYSYDDLKRSFPVFKDYRGFLKAEREDMPKAEHKIAAAQATRDAAFQGLTAGSKLIAVEVSPDCDHAQRKIVFPRFVCGLLTTTAAFNLLETKKSPSLWVKSNLWFDEHWPTDPDPQYNVIILNLQYVISTSLTTVKGMNPIMRLRDQLCTQLRTDLAAFMARPGIVFLS